MKVTTYILVLLAIISLICLLRSLRPIKEQFEEEKKVQVFYSILPSLQSSWIGTTLDNNNNIKMSPSLTYGFWEAPLKNSKTEEGYNILHLNYNKNMNLLGCGVLMDENKKLNWKLFEKESKNPSSKWKEVYTNIPVISTLFDSDGVLLGVHAENGQIYKKETPSLSSDFVGPINYDLPVVRILYDKDGILMGIGKDDGFLYKKTSYFWNESKWSSSMINKEEVLDVVHDYDGCMIASTKTGFKKQESPSFLQPFIPINLKHKVEDTENMSFQEIIQARCGFIPSEKNVETMGHLDEEFKKILNFKKEQKYKCKKRSKLLKKFIHSTEVEELNPMFSNLENQSKVIDNLQYQITTLQDKLGL
jgi:hypothetical protein